MLISFIPLPMLVQCVTLFTILAQSHHHNPSVAADNIAPLRNSQNVIGPPFIGHSVLANTLRPRIEFEPLGSLMHQDGGNSGSLDYPGPLGQSTTVSTYNVTIKEIIWDRNGEMIAGFVHSDPVSNTTSLGIATVDRHTLIIESFWLAEPGRILNFAYMEIAQEENQLMVAAKSGQLYVLQIDRGCEDHKSHLTLIKTIDLSGFLGQGELLLNSMLDTDGNIWFTTGGILAQVSGSPGDPKQNSSTVGYVEPDGTIHTLHIPNQMIENGIAISKTAVYVVTGPAAMDDHVNATGYLYHFQPGTAGTDSITVVWSLTYPSGNARKPGAFARGSGSTPALLGDQYVAITDNANEQIHMLIYLQEAATESQDQLVCSIPVFEPGAGNNDVGFLTNFDGDTYGLVVINNYNAPPLYTPGSNINGDFNNLQNMAAEVVRVNVSADGSTCSIAYDTRIRLPSVPVLSTETGLFYAYTQNEEAAADGLYEWYVAALDWRTGEVVWQIQTGAGGTLCYNYMAGTLGPDGTFYQAVVDGVVMLRDST